MHIPFFLLQEPDAALCEPVKAHTHTDYILFLAGRDIDLENIKTASEPAAPSSHKTKNKQEKNQKNQRLNQRRKDILLHRISEEIWVCNEEVSTESKKEF